MCLQSEQWRKTESPDERDRERDWTGCGSELELSHGCWTGPSFFFAAARPRRSMW